MKTVLDADDREQFEVQKEQLEAALSDLEESRNRYAELFDNAPVGYMTLDGLGRIHEVNLTAAGLLGHDRDRLRGAILTAFVHSRDELQRLLAHLASCRSQEKLVRTQLVLKAADETSPLPVELLSHPLENEANRYHTALVNRTEQAKAEAALREALDAAEKATRAKDDFIATLSHELRTPLNPVLLIASANANKEELSPEVRDDFEIIAKNVALEARLIDDLLDLTRMIRGNLSLELRPVDINSILRDALNNVKPELSQKHITVTTDLGDCPYAVLGDSVRLQQVFWNILRNAAKFTHPGGAISATTRMLGDESAVTIAFADSGIGMKAEEIGNVFDAFSHGGPAKGGSRHQFGGLGLGLTISQRLVDLHFGTITASSEGPMRGSTFVVELPLTKERLPIRADVASQSPPNGGHPAPVRARLLLVEDHDPTRLALQKLLTARGFDVSAAGTVAEAWELAGSSKFDLLLSDIGLPDGDGYLLMRELQERYGLRGIALTGYGMEDDIKLSKEAGFSAHLTKPIQAKVLDEAFASLGI